MTVHNIKYMDGAVLDQAELKRTIDLLVIEKLMKETGRYFVPVAVSNRHVHVSAADLETLFGKGHTLKKMRDLIQPGQFACEELVTLKGPKGSLEKVRVLGPVRPETQAEISLTDSYKLGVAPMVRMSGDLSGTPGCTVIGSAGEVSLSKGVVIAARHLHMTAEEAARFGLKDKDVVSVKRCGPRELTFGNVVVRAGKGHCLEMHIDTDEANAAGMTCGEILELFK